MLSFRHSEASYSNSFPSYSWNEDLAMNAFFEASHVWMDHSGKCCICVRQYARSYANAKVGCSIDFYWSIRWKITWEFEVLARINKPLIRADLIWLGRIIAGRAFQCWIILDLPIRVKPNSVFDGPCWGVCNPLSIRKDVDHLSVSSLTKMIRFYTSKGLGSLFTSWFQHNLFKVIQIVTHFTFDI